MIINPHDRSRMQTVFPGASFRELSLSEDFETGKIYFCGYWHQFFKVLSVDRGVPIWGTVYTVEWEYGETSTHSTRPDFKRGFEIVPV